MNLVFYFYVLVGLTSLLKSLRVSSKLNYFAGNFETSVAATTTETDVIGDMIQVLEISKLPHFDRFDRHVEQTADPKVARNKGKPLVPALTDYRK